MGNDSTQESWQLLLQLCPRAPDPDSPYVSVVHSSLPLLEPSIRGCKQNVFVLALLEALCICSHLSLADRNTTDSHSWMLSGFLSWLRCYSLWSPTWGLDSILLRGNPWQLKYPSGDQLPPVGAQPALFSALPTSDVVVNWLLLSALYYNASLQLVFSWLLRMISLQFSCNPVRSWEEIDVASTYSSAI